MAQLPILPTAAEVHDLSATEAARLVQPADKPLDISTSPRDALVNIIAKAIECGVRIDSSKHPKVNSYYAGAVSGYVDAANMLIQVMYSTSNEEGLFTLIMQEIESIHLSWSDSDLGDAAKVGQEADSITTKVIDSL